MNLTLSDDDDGWVPAQRVSLQPDIFTKATDIRHAVYQ